MTFPANMNTSDNKCYYSKPGTFAFSDDVNRVYTFTENRNLNRNAGGDDIFLGLSNYYVD